MSATFTTLHEAAGRGDLEAIEREIDNGVDLNVVGKTGSPMYVAACSSQWHVVMRLLSAGADPNAGGCGKYPLCRAAEAGEDDVVKALLAAGADVNVVGCLNIHMEISSLKVDHAEFSPLMIAAWRHRWPVVLILIAAGADVNEVTFEGSPLIWLAFRGGAGDVVDALIADPRTNLNATFCNTPWRMNNAGKMQFTLIAAASERKDWLLVQRLAAAGADVAQFGADDLSVLQHAAHRDRHDVVEALLGAGADPNLANKRGQTALHFARSEATVRALIAAGALVDAKDVHGKTALRCTSDNPNKQIRGALIEAGANVNAVDNDNVTILEEAVRLRDIWFVQTLLDRGAVFDWTKDDQASVWLAIVAGREDEVDRLAAKGAVDVYSAFGCNRTPLTLAAMSGRASMATKLVGLGAFVDGTDANDCTALEIAAICGFEDVARVLLAAGADVDGKSIHGDATALHWAARRGHVDVVRLLIGAGALIDTTDSANFSPLQSAAQNCHWPVVAMLARAQHGLRDCNYALDQTFERARYVMSVHKIHPALVSLVDLTAHFESSARDAMLALLDAGATLEAVLDPVARSGNSCSVALMLAAGADPTIETVDADVRPLLAAAGWQPPSDTTPARLEEIIAAIPAAKKQIERAGFAMIRERALEICVALQALHLPAPQLIEIVTASCEPFAQHLPYHYLWDAVVLVKHFHDRSSDAE